MFFVATAVESGRINLSPKGMDSFRVLGNKQVAWLNVTGSGNETAAHVQQSPRMTIMFCAYEGQPLIFRIYGSAEAVHEADPKWPQLITLFPEKTGARQIFVVDIDMVQTSCGKAVPLYSFENHREALDDWADQHCRAGVKDYWARKNQQSIDSIPTNIMQLSGLTDE
jgi:hypothetical protein